MRKVFRDDHEMFRDQVRRFVDREIVPFHEEWEHQGFVPKSVWHKAGQGAAIAHAVLGAIGFTYEHSLHFTTRRLWSWRSEFGSQSYWAQDVGRRLCGAGQGGLWPAITTPA